MKQILYIIILIIIIYNIINYIYNEQLEIKIKRDKIRKYNNCRPSTINNPYMNRDIMDNRNISACSDVSDKQIQDNLTYNLYQDETDINGLKKLRIFMTMVERDYDKFNEYLKGDNIGCKNMGIGCNKNYYLRFNR